MATVNNVHIGDGGQHSFKKNYMDALGLLVNYVY